MVRSFALLLVLGIAIAFGLAVTAGFAALSLRRDSSSSPFGRFRSSGGWRGKERGPRTTVDRPQAPLIPVDRTRLPEALGVHRPRAPLPRPGHWIGRSQSSDGASAPKSKPTPTSAPLAPQNVREVKRSQQAPGRDRRLRRARRQGPCPRPDRSGDAASGWPASSIESSRETVSPAPDRAASMPKSVPGRRSPTSSSAKASCAAPTCAPRSPNCRPTRWPRSPRSTPTPAGPATRRCSASGSAPSRWKTSSI